LLLVQLLIVAVVAIRGAEAAPEPGRPSGPGPVTAVSTVDLARYRGFWYEIAKIPNQFQKQCARQTIAHYSQRADGQLNVLNQCIKKNGNADQARGIARVVDPTSRAKLKVSLVSFWGWRPFWGDYWIIGLDQNYRWAIVGTPDRHYGWILARSQRLDPATLETILTILERNGYQRTSFKMGPQGR
jgi:apolipoprotein D and lipocalin family protein